MGFCQFGLLLDCLVTIFESTAHVTALVVPRLGYCKILDGQWRLIHRCIKVCAAVWAAFILF
jgi:hypothetical protein